MFKVFSEILRTYQRTALFSAMSLAMMLMLMISEAFDFTSTSIDFIATTSILLIAVGLCIDAVRDWIS